jgi:ATP-dependent 26S proteasome regulatory subunit
LEQSKRTEQEEEEEEEQWVKDNQAGCRASKEVHGIEKVMLTIRRRRSTSMWHCRPTSARSSGSRRDPKQPLACPWFTPATKCKPRLLKLDRVKDYLLMGDPLRSSTLFVFIFLQLQTLLTRAIVSSSVGPEYYVNVLLFVDKDQLEPGCAILMHNKVFFSFYVVHIAFEKEQW